jgi:mRNA-degrading endonuclease RelE of RelBE toxin-antitoxin system
MYNIQWENKAVKQLDKIADSNTKKDIKNGVEALTNWPDVTNIKKLTNHQYDYRLRIGRYRIFFDVEGTVNIIHIEEVKKRDDRTY